MTLNFYTLYRLILLGFTLGSIVQFVRQVLIYKSYYDRLPNVVKTTLQNQIRKGRFPDSAKTLLKQNLDRHCQDLTINGLLLLALLVLNTISYTLVWL